jgi:hypothetical protein
MCPKGDLAAVEEIHFESPPYNDSVGRILHQKEIPCQAEEQAPFQMNHLCLHNSSTLSSKDEDQVLTVQALPAAQCAEKPLRDPNDTSSKQAETRALLKSH